MNHIYESSKVVPLCDVASIMDSNKKQSSQDITCPLCRLPLREPCSGPCKHPACKCCWAVYITRDLQDLSTVPCPICNRRLTVHEIRPDQDSQRRLQKHKNARCKNCSWKGSYSEYKNHERVCGGIARIQCTVFGCGKWLPKDKALDVHRSDDWCPMILLMKARLSHAEIVHLSMRESWNWTCGLVLRSEKPSVRKYIKRLVLVFSSIDPSVPTSLKDDEYGATAQEDIEVCDSNVVSSSTDPSRNCGDLLNDSIDSANTVIGDKLLQNLCRDLRKDSTPSKEHTSPGAAVLLSRDGVVNFGEVLENESDAAKYNRKHDSDTKGEMKQMKDRIRRIEVESDRTMTAIEHNKRHLDDLRHMSRAFAALNERQTVHEGILAMFNNEVISMSSRIENIQVPSMLANNEILEKLVKANQDINRSITSLAQSIQKLDARLLDVETSHSGIFLWKIANYSQKKRDAASTNIKSIYSPPFFTSQYGYKLCGRLFPLGDGVGKGTHISLFLTIMKGPHDAVLPWPFREKITFQLVNQVDPRNKSIVEAFRPDPASSSFKRPTAERNIGAGCPLFAKIQVLEDPYQGFVNDDTLYLKIISQTVDLPEFK